MGRSLFAIALLALGATAAVAEDVLTLTGETFAEAVKTHEKLIVEFYAPWCGHCKKLEPEYEAAAGPLKEEGITLAKVDATEEGNKELASKFGVQGFPTLKIFRGSADSPSEYEGPREKDGIISYSKKQFGPAFAEITTADEATKATTLSDDLSVVGTFPAGGDSDAATAFKAAAEALRNDCTFTYTTDAKLVKEAEGKESIMVFRNFDTNVVKFDGSFNKVRCCVYRKGAAVCATAAVCEKEEGACAGGDRRFHREGVGAAPDVARPHGQEQEGSREGVCRQAAQGAGHRAGRLQGPRGVPGGAHCPQRRTRRPARAPPPPLHGPQGPTAAVLRRWATLDRNSRHRMQVIFMDPAENSGAMTFFGASADALPAILIHDPKSDGKFNSGVLEVSKVKAFVEDFKAGKIEKTVKSEEPPAENDGPVTVVVGKTFEEIVMGAKNVLIEFYAPWCGHCKKLEPIYNELGEAFKDNSSVVIAKMDATANDVPVSGFDVKGFPTIMFVTDKGEIKSYDGGRALEDFTAYLNKELGIEGGAASATDSKDEL